MWDHEPFYRQRTASRRHTAEYVHRPFRPSNQRWHWNQATLYAIALLLCGVYYVLLQSNSFLIASSDSLFVEETQKKAEHLMKQGIRHIARERAQSEYPLDVQVDPNATGLIGISWSDATTTLGDLQAKRTATNPQWAAAVVRWMYEAGVQKGDTVWATFSGSFPGLNLAVFAAAEALGARLYAVSSLGASTWGANIPDFVWSDMERVVQQSGMFQGRSLAVSLGGTNDQGPSVSLATDEDPGFVLRQAAERSSLPLLLSNDLATAVASRLAIFEDETGTSRPAMYVNVGGGHTSIGDCADAYRWPIGLTTNTRTCRGEVPGLLYILSERHVPVLHLLNVKELAVMTGIPIDGRFDTT